MNILNNKGRFTLIAGPCVIESKESIDLLAGRIQKITNVLDIDFYFKASVDKANRTTAEKYRGPGFIAGLKMLQEVKDKYGLKVVTDIHEPAQAEPAARVVDMLQIPAFLCRQTDLLKAAAETGKIINVKKAQFLSPEEMGNVVSKLEYFGNNRILLCERGTSFGYHSLVVDMTSLVRLKEHGYPVVFDATHSVQISGGGAQFGNSGNRKYVPYLAKAAVATGAVDAIFMEVHDQPEKALCDGSCMLPLADLQELLSCLLRLNEIAKGTK